VIAVTGAFVMMNRNEVKTGNTSSVSETKKKNSEKSGIAKASDEENNAEISYDAENDGFFGLHTSDDKTVNEAEEIADETEAENTGDAATEEQEVQAAEQAPKNDTSASDRTSAATAAKSDRTSTTAASDNTAASDTTQSAEDISKKIKGNFRERAKRGEMLGGPVAYGYKRNPEDKGYFLIDEEAAAVVRYIFDLKISGMLDPAICRRLDAEGIMTPRQYHDLKVKGVLPEIVGGWKPDTVRTITLNPVYLGHMVHGKFKEKQYLGQRASKARRKDWVVYENVNPPIVSQETFDKAQEVREKLYRGEIKRWKTR
jgi:hypothetical protein